jgi:hypothetical protein
MKKAIIIQPGKMGDLLLITPIAKYYYENGYQVDIPVFSNFKNFFNRINYINCIDFDIELDKIEYHNSTRMKMWEMGKTLEQQLNSSYQYDGFKKSVLMFEKIYNLIEEKKYDLIIDPCWGFAGHRQTLESMNIINESYKKNQKWITTKYKLSKVPLEKRYDFVWERDENKEDNLLKFIKSYAYKKYGSEEYSVVHSYKSESLPNFSVKNPINFSYINGYEIYDWIKVLENAETIVCVDSCLSHFVETQASLYNIKKIYIGSEEKYWHYFMHNILKNNWTNYTNSDITNE